MEDNLNNENQLADINFVSSEIGELNQLIALIVDYYCFKTESVDPNESEDAADNWKKGTKWENKSRSQEYVPNDIDKLIKQTFKTQLKKFI
jgi:hypothetical protein